MAPAAEAGPEARPPRPLVLHPLGLAALICGVLSIPFHLAGCCCILLAVPGLALSTGAIICGVLGRKQFDPAVHSPESRTFATVGLAIGAATWILRVIQIIVMVVMFGAGFLLESAKF